MAYTYAPRTTDRSGEIMGRGIESVGGNIADAMQRSKEKKKEADYYRKLGEAMGLDPGFVAGASAEQLKGAIDARAIKRTEEIYDKSKQQEGAFAKAMGMSAEPQGGGPTVPMPTAMARTGVTDPRLIQAGVTMTDAMKPDFQPRVVDAGNGVQALMTSDNSAVPLRSGAGAMTEPRVISYLPGPDGKVTGFAVVDTGDGKRKVVNTASRRALSPLDFMMMGADLQKGTSSMDEISKKYPGDGPTIDNVPPPGATGNQKVPVTPVSGAPGGTSFNDEFFSNFGFGDGAGDEEE